MNLWGVSATEKTEQLVDVPGDRDLLVTRIALGPNAPKGVATVVSLVNHDYDDETYVLGTLRAESCEQFECDVNICSESSVTFKVTGPGTVHFVGYYNRLASFEDDYSDYSDEESYSDELDSDDEEINSDDEYDSGDEQLKERIARYMANGEDDGSDDSDDSDDDIEVEEEVVTKSPIKQKKCPTYSN